MVERVNGNILVNSLFEVQSKLLPNESIVYFGDTARVPYGNKSRELIKEYSLEIADFLMKHNAKMIVSRATSK